MGENIKIMVVYIVTGTSKLRSASTAKQLEKKYKHFC